MKRKNCWSGFYSCDDDMPQNMGWCVRLNKRVCFCLDFYFRYLASILKRVINNKNQIYHRSIEALELSTFWYFFSFLFSIFFLFIQNKCCARFGEKNYNFRLSMRNGDRFSLFRVCHVCTSSTWYRDEKTMLIELYDPWDIFLMGCVNINIVI